METLKNWLIKDIFAVDFIYISKAYDIINHNILVTILDTLGFS